MKNATITVMITLNPGQDNDAIYLAKGYLKQEFKAIEIIEYPVYVPVKAAGAADGAASYQLQFILNVPESDFYENQAPRNIQPDYLNKIVAILKKCKEKFGIDNIELLLA